jgi:predicted nucleic acid-binding protein
LIARITRARADGATVSVPTVVLAEVTRGSGPRDARLNMTIAGCDPSRPLDEATARFAGRLLARAGGNHTVDAIVAAEAIQRSPTILFTSDPDDLSRLLDNHPGVVVVAI